MIKLLTIIGARPQIIKAAALSKAVAAQDGVEEVLLHTGQHYDENMSEVFFRELGIPAPKYNLGVGSGPHGEQTARMIEGIEQVLMKDHFDGVVLYGDTNSTLAGAVAASKLQVPVFHIEAGLRSFNRSMPEEINRIVADHLGSLLFAPTQTAVRNLENEGLEARTVLSGDVMYDNALRFAPIAENKSNVLQRQGLHPKEFVLATIHRPVNTDNPQRLEAIFNALLTIAEETKVVVPLHPRTKNALDAKYGQLKGRLILLPPASFFDIIALEKNARVVVTDSGGVQKEAFFYGTPSIILRKETEWVEIVNHGAGILADADENRIQDAWNKLKNHPVDFPALFGDGHAAEAILGKIVDFIK